MPAKRFTRGEARAALLKAGLQLMVERGPSPGLDTVSFAEAITLSDVPRPSAYRAFAHPETDPQDHFREALAVEVIDSCAFKVLEPTADAVAHLIEAALQENVTSAELDWLMRETIRIGVATYQAHISQDPLFVSFITLIAARQPDTELSDVLESAEIDAQRQYIDFYRILFDSFGLRLRREWTWEALATAVTAMQTGDYLMNELAIGGSTLERATGPDGEMQPWTLYACMTEAVIAAATEPDPRMVVSAQPHRWLHTT